jgi:Glucose / Sorbosone dehydrogenase
MGIRRRPTIASLALIAGLGLVISWPRADRADAASSAYRLVKVATAKSPVGVIWHPVTKKPYVIEQGGTIRPAGLGAPAPPVLDVSKQVSTGGEQGLLGASFSNDGNFLYVDLTNTDGDTEIREYQWKGAATDTDSKRVLLSIDQPYSNHNGGNVVVDSKGYLWIGMGDGGSGGDPEKRAQNTDSLLGKLLRINPIGDGDKPYSIPSDNPFVSGGGRPEIWATGLRNPWRFDIDTPRNQIFIGDVGQDKYEEVNVASLDQVSPNFGWNLREGMHAYGSGAKPAGVIDPVYEYPHKEGCSVTGGVVYRGTRLRGLAGSYFFGDYCKGWLAITTNRGDSGKWTTRKLGLTLTNLSSLNRTPDGEIWVTSTSGAISLIDAR